MAYASQRAPLSAHSRALRNVPYQYSNNVTAVVVSKDSDESGTPAAPQVAALPIRSATKDQL